MIIPHTSIKISRIQRGTLFPLVRVTAHIWNRHRISIRMNSYLLYNHLSTLSSFRQSMY